MDAAATGGKTGNSGNPGVTGPLLGSRRVRLESVSAAHVPFLHALASNPLNGFRWQHGGNVPPLEVFEANLWHGVLAQHVVVHQSDDRLVGHCLLYNPEINHGHVSFGAIVTPDMEGSGIGAEASFLCWRLAFKLWNLRKIYLDLPEFNVESIAGGVGAFLHEEARLRDHLYYDGRWWDRVTLTVYRADVEALEHRFGSLLGDGARTGAKGGTDAAPAHAGTSNGVSSTPLA